MPAQHDTALREAFGGRIKELRKQKKWTQKELAQRLDIHHAQLNKYEMGLNIPPLEKLMVLVEALETSMDYLLFGNPSDDATLHNTRLRRRFLAVQELPAEDQETVISVLDAMIVKHRTTWATRPVDVAVGK
jgi:transcriptional regulator with XRE-family HTH domain